MFIVMESPFVNDASTPFFGTVWTSDSSNSDFEQWLDDIWDDDWSTWDDDDAVEDIDLARAGRI